MAEKKNAKKSVEKKVDKKVETKVTEKVEKAVEVKPEKKKVEKKNKELTNVRVMTNSELIKLFNDNGCLTKSTPKDSSSVVYNTFGTKSRVLQQNRAYQLLLTNGHEDKKGVIVDTDNDDTERFIQWYGTLTDEQKKWVKGFDEIKKTTLAKSEMPRERSVKLTDYNLLVVFLQYMATFSENKVATN
jgi:hypothetical protein